MDVSQLLDGLNDKQREAVAAPAQNMLILAGAGSGKTRVLVHRIAWLVKVEQVSPHSILAVTFTNKAAAEMRARVEQTIGGGIHGMWIGTFHGLAHRLLRMHFQEAKLPQTFQVLDSDDQLRMVKRVIRSLNLDEKRWPAKQAQWYINGKKDEGLRPQHIECDYDQTEQTFRDIYQNYQQTCDRSGLVDFAELLLRAHELWLNNPVLLNHYQQRFGRILVDEFQDTNAIQYAWLNILGQQNGNVMIVGDDDQSIYGWRGAKIENIQRFLNDFEGAKTIRLEQNYRSTSNILNAANELIANNSNRLGKELWTEDSEGEKVSIYAAFNELDEARFIAGKIEQWQDAPQAENHSLDDVAILYRSNAQSRVLEEALRIAQIPYRIYGGQRFFERQEVKDALAYMRLIANRNDDAAFERVVNKPTRGIGEQSLSLMRDAAKNLEIPLWQVCKMLLNEQAFTGRGTKAVGNFLALIDQLEDDSCQLDLDQQVNFVIQHSGLKAMYEAEKGEKAASRIDNLNELVTACQTFSVEPELEEELTPLNAFLTHAALEAGDAQADEYESAVQLMTMHSAKGLEFPLVFIAGLEEGMFPSQQSAEEAGRLEEERRLCYVGMTRAMKKLYLCHAETRRLYGQQKYHRPSRFLKELPSENIEEIRLRSQVKMPDKSTSLFSSPVSNENFADSSYSLGQRVNHPKFGEGTIINCEGGGAQSRIQINFDEVGSKWLVVAYARLSVIQ
ncbi:MAG: DNA helicase II [Alteromonadaceae bacterium]|nr:DNA helicase II [Alteromonadaceae bacterium]